MNRRSFLAAAVAALTGATVAKSALLPLTLPDTPIELAKQAGIPVPPVAVVTQSIEKVSEAYGIHPALLADSPLDIHSMVYEKFAREVARKLNDDMWMSVSTCQKIQYKLAYHCGSFTGLPVRRFSLDDQKTPR
jgi:secreted PhoX family phosphatase